MKIILKIEEAAEFIFGIFVFSQLNFVWWWFPVLLLTPDISMIGYVINSKVGAFCYNLFHSKAIAILIGLTGFYFSSSLLILIGVILFSHSALDRFFGYGLKYPDGFKNTHLGIIGK